MFGFFNGTFSSPSGSGYIPEMEQIISQLERGTLVTKFSWRRKAERKTLAIRRETRQIVWTKTVSVGKPVYDGTVDLREVKEIRIGKNSKDFDKWPEDSKKIESGKCFVVFYGSEFKLRVLSITALSEKECELWVKGLRYLVKDTVNNPYPLQVQTWLRREFYSMETPRESVSLKEVKAFLPRLNSKIPTNRLREIFNEVDTRKRGEIGFDDFAILYHKIIFDENNIQETFDRYALYSSNSTTVTLQEFQSFLVQEQHDELGSDERRVSEFIRDFLKDPQRDVQEPYFTMAEFLDFLFSKQNDVWDGSKDIVYQDMTKPLAHYYISSSHNTYLTGDQFSSDSSVEAYVRCLRMGCRCIELDCWDGPDGMPFIYHGHTLTTKIKFLDVIRTIKEHAFATSEYPVILSIEDNCSLPQQRKMATAMQEVFGDMLVSAPVEKNEKVLPSPYQLRRKIILKHKKLPEGQEEASFFIRSDGNEMDLRNSIKNGIMYIEDAIDHEWNPHFFVLTQNKLFFTDSYRLDQESERSEDEDEATTLHRPRNDVPNEELHFSEKWFHGRLPKGREEAEHLLKTYSHLGDGTFLVRTSVTFVGEYCLSFWRNGSVNHCRIKSKQDKQQTKYYLTDTKYFESLYSLITHYRAHPLVTAEFSITLQEPVPQPNKHEGKEWYHKNTSRIQAEEMLKSIGVEGAFLVRPSENDANSYTISFRADKKIKHCRIKLEGRLYTIGNVEFESLVELINYYEHHPLYHKVKLCYAVSEEIIRRMGLVWKPGKVGEIYICEMLGTRSLTFDFVVVWYCCVSGDYSFTLYQNPSPATEIDDLHLLNAALPTYIIAHGWLQNGTTPWVVQMKNAYLSVVSANVVVFNWAPYSQNLNYLIAEVAVKRAGEELGKMIVSAFDNQSIDISTTQLVGFSLGAHVVGVAGNFFKAKTNKLVEMIVGLETPLKSSNRLTRDSGKFVLGFHTSVFGKSTAYAHVDVYFGVCQFGCGISQRNCPNNPGVNVPSDFNPVWCNHVRSVAYWIESILNNRFFAVQGTCSLFRMGLARGQGVLVGYGMNTTLMGSYFLRTNGTKPFGKGADGV